MAGSGSRGKHGQKSHRGNSDVGGLNRHSSPAESEVRAGASRPRIEPGEYDAICYKVEVGRAWRRNCYVLFRIYGGKYDGTELFMACPYPEGRISTRFKLYDQWTLAIGRPPRRGERFSPRVFKNKMYGVLVRDTRRKFLNLNRLKPDYCQYSVVETIIETQTGVPGDH